MILSQLESFITHPKRYILLRGKYNYPKFTLLCLALATSPVLTETNAGQFNAIALFSITFVIYIFFLAIQSMVTDFFAQLLKFKANSLNLFLWLGIGLLPLALLMPINILSQRLSPNFYFIWDISTFIIFLSVLYLHILSVKTLYQTSTKKAIVIYFLPIISFIGFVLISAILVSLLSIFLRF